MLVIIRILGLDTHVALARFVPLPAVFLGF